MSLMLPLHYSSGKACGLVGLEGGGGAFTKARFGLGPILEIVIRVTTCEGSEVEVLLLFCRGIW